MDSRLELLQQWCCKVLPSVSEDLNQLSISNVAGDASFRRYFRIVHPSLEQPLIAMDAPPDKEDIKPFASIAKHWRLNGIPVPDIIEENETHGFLLLEDFGDDQMLSAVIALNEEAQGHWYQKALKELHKIQHLDGGENLPPYDAALLQREMDLFTDWLIAEALKLTLSEDEQVLIDESKDLLIQSALQQAKVVVHRDYHSRNIMVLQDKSLGIIDFQDAVWGPLTYDLVSLVRDCYIQLNPALVRQLVQDFHRESPLAKQCGLNESDFRRAFNLMGIQRHMKASGIFARLALRDGKWSYIQDIPLTLRYIIEACRTHEDLQAFGEFVANRVLPAASKFAELQHQQGRA